MANIYVKGKYVGSVDNYLAWAAERGEISVAEVVEAARAEAAREDQ